MTGDSKDEEIERRIIAKETPPIRNSEITAHLSESSIQLIEHLMQWDPEKRLTASQMLQHPWVQGETALTGKMADSDKKLSQYRAYKSRLEAKVFSDMVNWSDNLTIDDAASTQQVSLLERAFHSLDGSNRGYITKNDLKRLSGIEEPITATSPSRKAPSSIFSRVTDKNADDGDEALDLSEFSELLGDSMKNRYFPKGHIVYREGDTGDKMYFINSGTIEVTTSDGYTSNRYQGDTFGEGALLNPNRINTSTIKCKTPVHAIEVSREFFEKYMSGGDKGARINLAEKDRTRKRERANRMLKLYPNLKEVKLDDGDKLFHIGDPGSDHVYIMEEGKADVLAANGKKIFSIGPGEMCGEHSVMHGGLRNTSVICVGGDEGCKFRIMSKEDLQNIMDKNPWWVKKSLDDISRRREFQNAIVMKTGKSFPTSDLDHMRQVFDAVDVNNSGKLESENIREMLVAYGSTFTEEDIRKILDSLVRTT